MAGRNTVKLYSFPQVINLTSIDRGVRNQNMPFGDSDFRIYRGAHNPIEFVVRDNDRKRVSLIGKCLTMTVINFFSNTPVLQKQVEPIDPHKGLVRVTFTPLELSDLEASFYKYSILVENEDGTTNLLFTDRDHNAAGFFELIEGVLPDLVESIRLLGSDFTPVNLAPPTTHPTEFISGAQPGDALLCESNGLHTIAVYVTDFAGKFFAEGSLEENPMSNPNDWFQIKLNEFFTFHEFGNTPDPDCTFTGIEAFNFTGSIRWVRFRYIPDLDNPGTLDQVLYRN